MQTYRTRSLLVVNEFVLLRVCRSSYNVLNVSCSTNSAWEFAILQGTMAVRTTAPLSKVVVGSAGAGWCSDVTRGAGYVWCDLASPFSFQLVVFVVICSVRSIRSWASFYYKTGLNS